MFIFINYTKLLLLSIITVINSFFLDASTTQLCCNQNTSPHFYRNDTCQPYTHHLLCQHRNVPKYHSFCSLHPNPVVGRAKFTVFTTSKGTGFMVSKPQMEQNLQCLNLRRGRIYGVCTSDGTGFTVSVLRLGQDLQCLYFR